MTFIQWCIAAAGMLLGVGIVAAVIFDCWLDNNGYATISKHIAYWSHDYPIIAVLISGPVFFILGCLAGHFWFPENP